MVQNHMNAIFNSSKLQLTDLPILPEPEVGDEVPLTWKSPAAAVQQILNGFKRDGVLLFRYVHGKSGMHILARHGTKNFRVEASMPWEVTVKISGL